MDLTWLDSNSWLIEIAQKRILLDPWLAGPLVFGNLTWLFKQERIAPRSIPNQIDLILLSQGLEDHTHPATLKQLGRHLPVVASPNAAKVVQGLGYTQVTALAHGETFTFGQVEIKAVPGSPIGPMLVENGYLLKDLTSGNTLYYEPHGYHSPTLKDVAPVDVIITPIVDLKIPLLGPIIQGKNSALEVCQWLQPQVILPTAAGKEVVYEGLLAAILREEGSIEEFRASLAQKNLSTKVLTPKPGETLKLALG